MQFMTILCVVEITVEYFYHYQYIIDISVNCVKQGVKAWRNIKYQSNS
jgi:hypothetical protein